MDSTRQLREHARRNLSALVITIEFTLISVMIAVILTPLTERAADLLANLEFEYWLYIVSGLLFILYIWTEVVSHSLSFVGWPIEFGHNLLYIVFTMLLTVQMNFLADPVGWFALTCLNTIVASAIVLYDRRVIEKKQTTAQPREAQLYAVALERQRGLVRILPLTLLNAIVPLALLIALPSVFIERSGHIILVAVQILALLFLLIRTLHSFSTWAQPILSKVIEELGLEETV